MDGKANNYKNNQEQQKEGPDRKKGNNYALDPLHCTLVKKVPACGIENRQ